jgi:uncharacterized Zn finger protein
MMGVFDINGGGQMPPQQKQMTVDINQASDIECSNCGNKFFHEVTFFKKLSALLSPTGQEAIIPIPTYACLECGNINEEFMPTKKQQLND